MSRAVALLTDAGVPHETHWATGERAEQIYRAARRLAVHHSVMGTARRNSLTRMIEDSVTHRVLETTPVPVEVIAGDAVAKWERRGSPGRRPSRRAGSPRRGLSAAPGAAALQRPLSLPRTRA
jgi:Universal stress protein family